MALKPRTKKPDVTDSEQVTVLLVGGDPDDRSLVGDALNGKSVCRHRIVNVRGCREALARLAEGGIDTVLLTLHLSEETGTDMVRRLREAEPDIPIVALAGNCDSRLEADVLRMGVQDYLPKGEITSNTLVRTIRHAIVRHATASESQNKYGDSEAVVTAIRHGTAEPVLGTNTDPHRIRSLDALLVEENNRLLRELSRSNAEVEQFAYVVSHDLQEPLRSVEYFANRLGEAYRGKLDAKADKYIDFATGGAERMRVMINDLLTYSRLGKTDAVEHVNVQKAVALALVNLEVRVKEPDADVDVSPMPVVPGRKSDLIRLFQNIIGNAIKFHGNQKPLVRLSSARDDGNWRISIADNGIGIEAKYLERIFGVFQRLHTREQYPGTGIGLAVCKKIVEQHGGRIWVVRL